MQNNSYYTALLDVQNIISYYIKDLEKQKITEQNVEKMTLLMSLSNEICCLVAPNDTQKRLT